MAEIEVPQLVGQRVTAIRKMTKAEMDEQGWDYGEALVIEFDSGLKVFPSQDPEGNGPGCLFGDYKGTGIYLAEESK